MKKAIDPIAGAHPWDARSRLPGHGPAPYRRWIEDRVPPMTLIYKICPETLWREAQGLGRFGGAGIDQVDGFIHFSTAAQVAETARRHFSGQDDLLLVAVEAEALGPALRFEPSRGGDLFPHLYGDLSLDAVRGVTALPLGPDGAHVLPEEIPA